MIARGEPILQIDSLSKSFRGLVALDMLSFEVYDGELLGLIGPNGAGKTVLVNVISGFYGATSGTIRYRGRDVTGFSSHELSRLGIARTYQNIRLFRRMTVLENVLVASKRHAAKPFSSAFTVTRHADIAAAMAQLERMRLADKADHPAGALAYGEARRLEIARALAGEPSILFLDEPAAGMNERETEELSADIRSCRAAVDVIVIIEHDMELLRELSDRLLVIASGSKIAEGPPKAVLADPGVIEAYLGADDDDD